MPPKGITSGYPSGGPAVLSISSGPLRCHIAPALGGAVTGLWWNDLPLVRSGPVDAMHSPRDAGCFALLPFSNRVGQGRMDWLGTTYSLQPTARDAPHAIHGVGWQRPWQVVQQHADRITLQYQHQADALWPFPFTARQTITLAQQRIALAVSYHNTHDQPVPVGLGWHPYFVKRPGCHVSFNATARWEVGDDKLPTHTTPSTGHHGSAANTDLDHCFEGWNGTAQITDHQLQLSITSATPYLIAYTRPDLSFFALEPVTHVSNALQLAQSQGRPITSLGLTATPLGGVAGHEVLIEVRPR